MRQLSKITVIAMVLLIVEAILSTYSAIAQQKSLKDQLVGAWTLVSADSVRPDGSKAAAFGSNPRGIMIFSHEGYFALVQMRAELPRIAANSRDKGTPEENKAIVEGSIAYFGTYSISEADKVMTLKLAGTTYSNLLGSGDQKRIITSLTPDELKFTNPRNPSGATLEVVWKRAK